MGKAGVPVHKLPTINLSGDPSYPCAQSSDRALKPAELAQAVKEVVTTLPEYHQVFHLMYFNNLDAPLPTPIRDSIENVLQVFGATPPGYELRLYAWMFAPLGAATLTQPPLDWWAFWVWQVPDMNFELELAGYVATELPYTSQEHDAAEPVPLLSDADVAAYESEKALMKICFSSPLVQPHGLLPVPHDINTRSWPITVADPPAYLVSLNTQVDTDGSKFVESDAVVNYQICTRYCDRHPFVDTTDMGQESWADSPQCEKP